MCLFSFQPAQSILKAISPADAELAAVGEQRGNQRNSGLKSNKITHIISHRGSMRGGGGSGEVIDKGMVLPFEPLCLTFRNMDYYVPMPKVQRFCLLKFFRSKHPPPLQACTHECTFTCLGKL